MKCVTNTNDCSKDQYKYGLQLQLFSLFIFIVDGIIFLPFINLSIGNNNSEIYFQVVEQISSIDVLEDNPYLIRIYKQINSLVVVKKGVKAWLFIQS